MLPARNLVHDRRGAVMVMGVFMATFLVGCLWYLIGIGDTTVYREKVQAAADAAAFASAVYHARGMNLVALLNVVLVCMLAALVALHIVQLIVGAITLAASVICAIPTVGAWACPIAADASKMWTQLNLVVDNVQKIADKVLPAIGKTQEKIALVSPWVGAARAEAVALEYGHPIQAGIAMSVSMVPSNSNTSDVQRFGLPLRSHQDDGCKVAKQLQGDWIFSWIPWINFLGSSIDPVSSAFQQSFCGHGGDVSYNGKPDAQSTCLALAKNHDPNVNDGKGFDFAACIAGFQAAAADPGLVAESNEQNGILDVDPNKKVPGLEQQDASFKQLSFGVKNGDDHFQVYGFVKADTGMTKRNRKGVAIPSWGKPSQQDGALIDDALESIGFAEAEFYYDQPGAWDEAKEVAVVNMKWRARLRRFRLPQIATNVLLYGIPSGVPGSAIFKNKGLSAFNDLVTTYLGDGSITSTLVYDVLKNGAFHLGGKNGGSLDGFIGERGESKVIH